MEGFRNWEFISEILQDVSRKEILKHSENIDGSFVKKFYDLKHLLSDSRYMWFFWKEIHVIYLILVENC